MPGVGAETKVFWPMREKGRILFYANSVAAIPVTLRPALIVHEIEVNGCFWFRRW
jgi:hypothetical protein